MKIETERLLLYPISDDAMRDLILQQQEPEMKQAYGEMLQGCLDDPNHRIWHAVWVMQKKEHPGQITGDFCFKGISSDGTIEIGYGLRPGFCRQGYMTEAVSAVCRWASTQAGVSRIEAEASNDPSIRVLQRSGFVATGVNGPEGPRFVYHADHEI